MKNRQSNKVRKQITEGKDSAAEMEKKWREHVENGTASEDTIEFINNLDTPCENGVARDCLGQCGGNAVADETGSCCEPSEMVGGSCFKDEDDPCPEGSASDDLGTCCDPSQLLQVGEPRGLKNLRTYICGGESQKYYGGKATDGFGNYCLPDSYEFDHPKEGYISVGVFDSYEACTSANK